MRTKFYGANLRKKNKLNVKPVLNYRKEKSPFSRALGG